MLFGLNFGLHGDIAFYGLNNFLPVQRYLEICALLQLSVFEKHAIVSFLESLRINLHDLPNDARLRGPSGQGLLQQANLIPQLLHLVLGLSHVLKPQRTNQMVPQNGHPVLDCPQQVLPHCVNPINDMLPQSFKVERVGVLGVHHLNDMLYFKFHVVAQLPDTHDLGNDVGLSVHLQVLADALRAQQINTLQTHVPHNFRRVGLAVVGGEGVRFADSAGGGEEGSGVGVGVGSCSVETGVLLVQKIHLRRLYIINMGGEESCNQARFHSRYGFVQAIQDRNFGLIKVYRKRELNFDYVMIFDRLFAPGQLTQVKQQIERIKGGFTLQQEPIFLRILTVEELSDNTCGGGGLRLYVQYLNYTLRDAIASRQQARQPFTPDQIMYVIQGALSAYSFLRSLNANYLTVRPDAIYLNPDGLLRFSPVRADSMPPQPQQCDCWMVPNEVHFEKSERQFLIQLKSTVLDLVEICPQDDQYFRKNYELLARINHVRTIQQLLGCLWKSEVETLLQGKRMETTQLSSVEREGLGQSLAKMKSSFRDSRPRGW